MYIYTHIYIYIYINLKAEFPSSTQNKNFDNGAKNLKQSPMKNLIESSAFVYFILPFRA